MSLSLRSSTSTAVAAVAGLCVGFWLHSCCWMRRCDSTAVVVERRQPNSRRRRRAAKLPKPHLEVCCDCAESVTAAKAGGAVRVELCEGLLEGGVTPSSGKIVAALAAAGDDLDVHVLIRPRAGDFAYTEDEVVVMVSDIQSCLKLGVDGVVIGALTVDGKVDMPVMRRLIDAAGDMSVTFHRAIDVAADPLDVLTDCRRLGKVSRILTSGCANSVADGVDTLKKLVEASKRHNGIVIMAGGGIRPNNVKAVVEGSGVNEVHATARTQVSSRMRFRTDPIVQMGPSPDTEFVRKISTDASVAAISSQL